MIRLLLAAFIMLSLVAVAVAAVLVLDFNGYIRGVQRGYHVGTMSVTCPVAHVYPEPSGWPPTMLPVAPHASKPPPILLSRRQVVTG